MRSVKEIQEDIEMIKDLLSGDLTKEERDDFNDTLELLKKEKESVENVKSESPKEAKATKSDVAANEKIKEITADISDIESLLAGELTAEERADFQDTLELLRANLIKITTELSEKAEKKEEKVVGEPQPKKGRGRPKKTTTEEKPKKEKKFIGRPKKTITEEKPKKEKKFIGRPKKVIPIIIPKKKPIPKKEDEIIVVDGVEYNLAICRDAMAAHKARKTQRTKTAKKYKSKKPAARAASNVEHLVDQIGNAVPDKKIEGNPKQVIATFREFKKKMNEAFNVLTKIINKSDVDLLKKSLKEIDDIIAKYK